jgi:ligand-binding sensor domain-containing protein
MQDSASSRTGSSLTAAVGLVTALLLHAGQVLAQAALPVEAEAPVWLEVPVGKGTTLNITSLEVGPSGALWIATGHGVYRLVDGEFRLFSAANGLPSNQVLALGSTWRRMIVATRTGVVWFDDLAPPNEMRAMAIVGPENPVNSLTYDPSGSINDVHFGVVFAGPGERPRWKGIKLDKEGRPQLMPGELATIESPYRNIVPGPLIGAERKRLLLCQVRSGRWHRCRDGAEIGAPLDDQPVAFLHVQRGEGGDSQFLILTHDRLGIWEKANQEIKWLAVGVSDGPRSLSRARTPGQVWLTHANELRLIDTLNLAVVRRLNLPEDAYVKDIAEQPNGHLWVATLDSRLLFTNLAGNPARHIKTVQSPLSPNAGVYGSFEFDGDLRPVTESLVSESGDIIITSCRFPWLRADLH